MTREPQSTDLFVLHDGTKGGFGNAVNVANFATLAITVTKLSGIALLEGSADGINYRPLQALNISNGSITSRISSDATCIIACGGLVSVRINANNGAIITGRREEFPPLPIVPVKAIRADIESPSVLELILKELKEQSLQLSLITGGELG